MPSNAHWLQIHWDRITPLHIVLYPISIVFRVLAAFRRAMYRSGVFYSDQLLLPVVVVGNISVGGTGKTPLTLALAQRLVERGWHPLIISRGYGGKSKEPQQVTADSTAQEIGDEPLLMARRNICPVWIGRSRAAAAHAAIQAHPECNIVLCDDGLQHYRLQRDVEIAVIDAMCGFGNGLLLPAGPLREPVARLKAVDAVVSNGDKPSPGQYTMKLSGEVFYSLTDPEKTATASDFRETRNHAVAGIGNPQRYFHHLEGMGLSFTPHPFPDHHPYSADDLAFPDCDAILLTEKDAVKCAAFADPRYWVLRVDAEIDPTLIDQILRKITPHGLQTS